MFYSISNCQRGLAGVSFGNFLIKQVVEEIAREIPKLSTFVTLSPVPNFADWLKRERAAEASQALNAGGPRRARAARPPGLVADRGDARAGAGAAAARGGLVFPACARPRSGAPVDPVARFHLGNGARLERLNWLADTSERGARRSRTA